MRGVVLHWSVTPARGNHDQCEQDWANIVAQHRSQGYNPSPAYNWAACQHGVRFEGRGWGQRSAANGTNEANRDYWAVCALQAPGDIPTPELLAALAGLIDEAPDVEARDVRPHSDFFATACCGDELRAWVASGAQSPAAPSPPKDDSMRLIKNTDNGEWYLFTATNSRRLDDHALVWNLAVAGVPTGEANGGVIWMLAVAIKQDRDALAAA